MCLVYGNLPWGKWPWLDELAKHLSFEIKSHSTQDGILGLFSRDIMSPCGYFPHSKGMEMN